MGNNGRLSKQDLKKQYADFFNVKYPGWNGYYLVDIDYSLNSEKGKNVIDMVFFRFDKIILVSLVLGNDTDLDNPAFLESILAEHYNGYYNNEKGREILVNDISNHLKTKVKEGLIFESPEYGLIGLDNLEIDPKQIESLIVFVSMNRMDLRLIKGIRQIEKNLDDWSEVLKKTKFLLTFSDEPSFVYEALEDEHVVPFREMSLRIKHMLMSSHLDIIEEP